LQLEDYNNCVKTHADAVFRFILKQIKDRDAAKDIVQDAFEKMWKKLDSIDASKAKSYLFTVAYNQMIDHIRKNKRIQLKEEFKDETKIGYQTNSNTKEVLMNALTRLNETQKSLIMLKDYEGYNYEEIGKIMSLNESQVKVYLHRARLALRDYLVKPENVL